jgi:hypothetical protein
MSEKIYKIKTVEQWNKREKELHEKGYRIWQTQYGADRPEGYFITFFNGRYDVIFHTFSEQVEKAMVGYEGRSNV